MIKGLTSSERLSVRGPDLRKVIRRRALNGLFQAAIERHENKRNRSNLAGQRPPSAISQIAFGNSPMRGSAARSLRSKNKRPGSSNSRRSKTAPRSTAIMEEVFIDAVQKMTLCVNPTTVDTPESFLR